MTSESGSLPPWISNLHAVKRTFWSKILDVIVTITLLHPKLTVLGVTTAKEMANQTQWH